MTISKPSFPNPSTSVLKAGLKKLEQLVNQVRDADGSVDVSKLSQKVEAQGDESVRSGFLALKDAFQRIETHEVGGNCGGPTTVHVDPKGLDAGEVVTILQALSKARTDVDHLDAAGDNPSTSGDGVLQANEARKADNLDGLSGKLAKSVIDHSLKAYKVELSHWNNALNAVADSVKERKDLSQSIESAAKHHAETSDGAEAATWAYRGLATIGHGVDYWEVNKALQGAETSWLRFIPLFGIARRAKSAQGHLSDKEIQMLLNTQDLKQYAQDKKAEIETKLGMSYENYLAGKDLDGAKQLGDPDFKRNTGCG